MTSIARNENGTPQSLPVVRYSSVGKEVPKPKPAVASAV
jgi:hypothetical protein